MSVTSPGLFELSPYLGYIIIGLIVCGSNFVIFLSIGRYSALRSRKEYLLLMALSLSDSIHLCAYIFAGIYRIWARVVHGAKWFKSASECLFVPHSIMWLFTFANTQLMLFIVSVDRFYSVAWPLRYYGTTRSYMVKLLSTAYGFCACMAAIGVALISIYGEDRSVPGDCVTGVVLWVVSKNNTPAALYQWYYSNIPHSFSIASVFVYIAMYPVYRVKMAKLAPSPSNATEAEQQRALTRQRKVTQSMAISCVCTVCLFLLPSRLGDFALSKGYRTLALWLWTASNANPLANCFIYQLRHEEMRLALKGLFKGKHMPANLDLWVKKQNRKSRTAAKQR